MHLCLLGKIMHPIKLMKDSHETLMKSTDAQVKGICDYS